jgi:hypothetical protein
MKRLFTPILLFAMLMGFTATISAQDLTGTWEREAPFGDKNITYVMLFSGSFFSWTAYYSEDGKFIATKGGEYTVENDQLIYKYEFDTADSNMVGMSEKHPIVLKGKNLMVDNTYKFKRTDNSSTAITGPWLFSGRKRGGEGEIQRRSTDGPRKTMKILTGDRFQWIAYNTQTKQFFGTGGGKYTAVDGKYTENIGFFSRDISRVGMSLQFNFEVIDGDWHHSGNNSRGEPMYDVWSMRK